MEQASTPATEAPSVESGHAGLLGLRKYAGIDEVHASDSSKPWFPGSSAASGSLEQHVMARWLPRQWRGQSGGHACNLVQRYDRSRRGCFSAACQHSASGRPATFARSFRSEQSRRCCRICLPRTKADMCSFQGQCATNLTHV